MILITKEQALYLWERFPDINITKTCRNKSNGKRPKRYVEASPKIVKALERFKHEEGGLV